jgi:DNA-binding CsgD family transcriptional regulator
VLDLALRGWELSRREIAESLFITRKTIERSELPGALGGP